MLQRILINASALQQNLHSLSQVASGRALWPTVKANAYGHGWKAVIPLMEDLVDGYCVVSTAEARQLRAMTFRPILVLNIVDPTDVIACARENIILPLGNATQLLWYAQAGQHLSVHIEIDTGMARTGWRWTDPAQLIRLVQNMPSHIKITGLFSHYAAAGHDDHFTRQQRSSFFKFVSAYQEKFGSDFVVHLDKTSSLYEPLEASSLPIMELIRPGIGVYGLGASAEQANMRPVMQWHTQIVDQRHISAGQSIGYNLTYVMPHDGQIATLPVGYADGLDRSVSNRGYVLVDGKRCPVRGLVCMNLTMIEIPPLLRVKVGDEVVIIGSQGEEQITASDMGKWADTSEYEIVTRLSPAIPRLVI